MMGPREVKTEGANSRGGRQGIFQIQPPAEACFLKTSPLDDIVD